MGLPHFAAFPLVERAEGRALLERYQDDYFAIAQAAGAGLWLESPTWRASPDRRERLGYPERRAPGPLDRRRCCGTDARHVAAFWDVAPSAYDASPTG